MASCDVRLYNIIILGLSFMFIFSAFQTSSMVEKTVINSIKDEANSTFTGDGYTSLSIIYIVFSVSNWGAPSVVAVLGAKISMVVGSLMYFLFIFSFLKPMTWALYVGSVLVGLGAAVLWTAQGNFLTINSDSETLSRNSGVFWALLQCSLLFGNLYTYLVLKGSSTITTTERTDLYIGLSAAGLAGVLLLFLLRKPRANNPELAVNLSSSGQHSQESPLQAFKRSFEIFFTKDMLLLSVTFFYTGIELTFFSGVFGTCVANNTFFGDEKNGLIGATGILIGVGEILGGATFGLFGKRTNKYGRDPIVLFGFLVHMVSFYLIFISLQNDSPIHESYESTYIDSNKYIAMLCAFLLGLGDSSFNTQIYSILGHLYPDDSSPAFALFKFIQSIAAAAGFFYSIYLDLQWQLLILVIFGCLGSLSFFKIEWSPPKAMKEGYQPI